MLRGELVGLRARQQSDVAVLRAGLHDDVSVSLRTNTEVWRPVPADGTDSPFAPTPKDERSDKFSVVRLTDDALVGSAIMWGIDLHNRGAHLGLSLLPEHRGQGYGADIVQVLCYYGFVVRGLRRLQIETLADNAAMIATANRAGFQLEGTLRANAWVEGQILDELILGLLAEEWTPKTPAAS